MKKYSRQFYLLIEIFIYFIIIAFIISITWLLY